MANGAELCCAAGVCCPANSAKRKAALVEILIAENPTIGITAAEMAADSVIKNFDTAPKGTLDLGPVVALFKAHGNHA